MGNHILPYVTPHILMPICVNVIKNKQLTSCKNALNLYLVDHNAHNAECTSLKLNISFIDADYL